MAAFGGGLLAAMVIAFPASVGAQHPTLPTCQPNDPNLLLPDLIAETPTQLRNTHRLGSRAVAFTTAIGNIGDGPLLVEGRTVSTAEGLKTQAWQIILKRDGSECARMAGEFIFHPAHFHWHFERFASYELREGGESGTLVAGGQKVTFCLLDVGMIRGFGTVDYPQQTRGNNCGPEGRQGISVGWKDIYLHNYADQYVQLDRDTPSGQPVPQGAYVLVNRVNPDHNLWEKDTTNNFSTAAVGVTEPPPAGSISVPTPTPRGVKPPNVRPPRERPTRPPREAFVPRVRPTRAPRPTRPPRGNPAIATPTRTPIPGANTPTPGGNPGPGPGGPPNSCETDCRYNFSQVRMTWYDATGLNFSALITPFTCPSLQPRVGSNVSIHKYDWLLFDKTRTPIDVFASFVIDGSGTAARSSNGSMNFTQLNESTRVTFNLSERAPARGADGNNFPVVYQTCIEVDGNRVPIRLVCQPKATGMLCHL